MEAIFRHGSPLMVDYTPSGAAVAAGQVVVIGSFPRIAHSDIADGKLGALATRGGVYEMPKTAGVSSAIENGVVVYWDDTNNVITETATGNKVIGVTVAASGDDDETQMVEHFTYVDNDT